MEITLDALLKSRDDRHALQQQLRQQHPESTLVCLTVVMPGSVKRNLYSVVTAQAALTALLDRLGEHVQATRARDLATGYEAYLITDLPALEAKRVTCDIEDSHPLGRLFDIDVMVPTVLPSAARRWVENPGVACCVTTRPAGACATTATRRRS